ncbi:U3 small nucleolar RNA-associated protein [Lachnellula suecica]|uniref:U3 small nucleolar RNA-associated protein n=1 Tax=Lachnellula suecica TaxID=602035 RepID=A0A8T9C0M9_9HELO|nr:U3 small nucleolar RNA-associated protein [Lachnellula suecica]
MSGPSDKARFHMEQAVPQLQEFKQKGIFNEEEIRTIVKKMSDFEHKVNGRGPAAVDYARYAAWEMSLENLRLKRCKRLRIKGSSTFSGQARIYNIFDRGTTKHPGDVALWMSYLECAREAKAMQKFKTILTAAIRKHPAKPDLWLYAARWTLQSEADMNGARDYMRRGTRFCIMSKELWIEYAKLEMIYLAKIAIRRKILGLDTAEDEDEDEDQEMDDANNEPGFDTSADVIAIPEFKSNSLRPKMIEGVEVDSVARKDPMTTLALNGAIPLAIFDTARKQPFFSPSVAGDFFDMFATFTQVRCLPKILQHVLDSMTESYPANPFTCNCYIKQPLVGLEPSSPKYPAALGVALDRLNESIEKTKDRKELVKRTKLWIEPVLEVEALDPGIEAVLGHTIRKLDS